MYSLVAAVILLTVGPRIKPWIEGAWRTHAPTKRWKSAEANNVSDCTVCPSQSRFRLITKDLGRFREMPHFALSRRQRGFESRWGHKKKPALTRPDTTVSGQHLLAPPPGRARDAGAPVSAAFGRAPDQSTLLGQGWGCECRRTCAVASLDLVLDGKALWRAAKDYRRVGDHQARAIRLKDARRRQNPRDRWRLPDHSPFSHNGEERISTSLID
jgi:hypothetical protein